MTGIGPYKQQFAPPLVTYDESRKIIEKLHESNIILHPYTFRADHALLPIFNNDFKIEEIYFYCCLGMDGLFTEFPDQSRESIALIKLYAEKNEKEENGEKDDEKDNGKNEKNKEKKDNEKDLEMIAFDKKNKNKKDPICSIDCRAY